MRLLFFTLFTSFSLVIIAQPTVWLSEGEVQLKSLESGTWVPVETSHILSDEEEIKVSQGGYVAVLDRTEHKLIELNDGAYTVEVVKQKLMEAPKLPVVGDTYLDGFTNHSAVLRCRDRRDDYWYIMYPFLDQQERFKVFKTDTIIIESIKNYNAQIESHIVSQRLDESIVWKNPMLLDSVSSKRIPVSWIAKEDALEGMPFVFVGIQRYFMDSTAIKNSLDEVIDYKKFENNEQASNRFLMQIVDEAEAETRKEMNVVLLRNNTRAYQLYAVLWGLENNYPFYSYQVIKKMKPLNGVSGAQSYLEGLKEIFRM